MRRMQVRVIEISVDVDDDEVGSLLESAIGTGGAGLEQRFIEAPGGTTAADDHSGHSNGPDAVASPVAPARVERRRKGRTRDRTPKPLAPPAAGDRQSLIEAILPDSSEHERYYRALTEHTEPGERAMVIAHLADAHGLGEVRSAEVVELLERRFSVVASEPSVRMALMRLAKVKPPLLAPREVAGGKAYWLTSNGKEKVAAWL